MITRAAVPGSLPSPGPRPTVVVLHSSDEHYGSDRVLLDVVAVLDSAADVLVLLPDDVAHGPTPLCEELLRRHPDLRVEHVSVPVLRRAAWSPHHLAPTIVRVVVDWLRLAARLRRLEPTMVWCATSATLLGAPAARAARVPSVILHVHEIWSGLSGGALRLLGRATTARISVSHAAERSTRLRRPAGAVIANSMRLDTVTGHRPSRPGRPLRYLVASRWGWWKGHATLLAAWDRAGCPGHLTVLGGPPPSGGGVDVARLVERHVGNPSSVTIVGEVPDIGPHLDETDVLILPSDRPEPFGLVVLEAFARGAPVIATRAGGVVDIVTDGVDGWLVEPRDVDGLAAVLASLHRDEVERAGRRAHDTCLTRFTPEAFRRELGAVIQVELTRATAGTNVGERQGRTRPLPPQVPRRRRRTPAATPTPRT